MFLFLCPYSFIVLGVTVSVRRYSACDVRENRVTHFIETGSTVLVVLVLRHIHL